MNDIIRQLDALLYSPLGLGIQIFSGFVTLGLFIFWVKLTRETRVYAMQFDLWREAFTATPVRTGKIAAMWSDVQKRMDTNDESEWKLAVIEADSIMDTIIMQLGYGGETMDERMQKIRPGQFPYLEDALRVHKVRNFIAHDASYKLKRETAERALDIYRTIFTEFNVV